MNYFYFFQYLVLAVLVLYTDLGIAEVNKNAQLTSQSFSIIDSPSTLVPDKKLTQSLKNEYVAICYHDVRDDVVPLSDPDRYAVSTFELTRQFEWMAANGYHPVSLEQIVTASKGGKPLPDNAVLLTFDDGYRSFYTHIFPLLKAYNYPAVFAIVSLGKLM